MKAKYLVVCSALILSAWSANVLAWKCGQRCPSSVFSGKLECEAYQLLPKCKSTPSPSPPPVSSQPEPSPPMTGGLPLKMGGDSDFEPGQANNSSGFSNSGSVSMQGGNSGGLTLSTGAATSGQATPTSLPATPSGIPSTTLTPPIGNNAQASLGGGGAKASALLRGRFLTINAEAWSDSGFQGTKASVQIILLNSSGSQIYESPAYSIPTACGRADYCNSHTYLKKEEFIPVGVNDGATSLNISLSER